MASPDGSQVAEDSLTPRDPSLTAKMQSVPRLLPAVVSAELGVLAFEQNEAGLLGWQTKLARMPTAKVTSLASSLQYFNRRGLAKTLSTSGSKAQVISRIMTYGRKYVSDNIATPAATLCNTSQDLQTDNIHGISDDANSGTVTTVDERALSVSEIARALHALSEAQSQAAAAKIFQPSSRYELDKDCSVGLAPVDAGWLEISVLYNDRAYAPKNINPRDADIEHIDPSKLKCRRGPQRIKSHLAQLRSKYTNTLKQYTRSGHNEDDFFKFCYGDTLILYCYRLLKECPQLARSFPRDLPEGTGVSTDGDAPIPDRPRRSSENIDDIIGDKRVSKKQKRSIEYSSGEISTCAALREHTAMKMKLFENERIRKEEALSIRKKEHALAARQHEVQHMRSLWELESKVLKEMLEVEKEIERLDSSSSTSKRNHLDHMLKSLQTRLSQTTSLIQESRFGKQEET
jgi:hypothetical protein